MIRMLVLAVTLAMQPAIAMAQSVSDSDRAAIRSVIESQLDAFQRDNSAEAFSYASPEIQSLFGTAETFMNMVRDAYPPVYRPNSFEFRTLDTGRANPVQDVFLIGPDGTPVIARYLMEKQPDGRWRIDGCILTEPQGLAV